MAPQKSTGNWTGEALVALVMHIMRQTNPDLKATNWKAIADVMEPAFGMNQNVMCKKYGEIRTQFLAANPQLQTEGAVGTPSKRKRIEKNDATSATPAKKARSKAACKSAATVEDAEEDEENGNI